MNILWILILIASVTALKIPPQTPIIGIYTQYWNETSSFISGSAVKWIQMSGAQVVPIYSFNSTASILEQVSQVNGVFFPGGTMFFSKSNQWTRNAGTILQYAKEQNDKGNVFPIFGTCLGLQLLSFVVSDYNCSVLSNVHDDINKTHPIHFTEQQSYIYERFTPHLVEKVSTQPGVFFYYHSYGVGIDTVQTNEKMKSFWKLTAWSTSGGGETFVASMQGKTYPVYAIQYHPQISVFEWNFPANRSKEVVQAAHVISQAFIRQARLNKNRFKSLNTFINKLSIFNYPIIKPQPSKLYNQVYIIDEIPTSTDKQ